MSSFIGGRSGNRGKCAGTCRLPFDVTDINGNRLNKKDEKYLLSMCDLNTLKRLADMIEAGVYSFKIEGRMKSPEYTAAVTSVYRKYLDIAEAALSGLEAEKDCGFEHRNGDLETNSTCKKVKILFNADCRPIPMGDGPIGIGDPKWKPDSGTGDE